MLKKGFVLGLSPITDRRLASRLRRRESITADCCISYCVSGLLQRSITRLARQADETPAKAAFGTERCH